MRFCRMLPIAVLTASVCACSNERPPIVKTAFVRPIVPASAREKCKAPVSLPDRALNQRETTSYWGRDRTSLRECETRRGAAVAAFEHSDAQIPPISQGE